MTALDRRRMAVQLTAHEGRRLIAYRDTEGIITIGVGRNLEDKGISESECSLLLQHDIEDCVGDLHRNVRGFRRLSHTRKMVLVDMCFNLGIYGLLKFKRMFAAMRAQDYDAAGREMLDSRWAEQVGQRAITLAEMMRTNESKW